MRWRRRNLFCSENLEKPTLGKKSTCPPFGYSVGKVWTSNVVVMTQGVKVPVSPIGQEVVPWNGLETQEVDVRMPGIPTFCCFYEKGFCFPWYELRYGRVAIPCNDSLGTFPHSVLLKLQNTMFFIGKLSCTPKLKVHNSEMEGK